MSLIDTVKTKFLEAIRSAAPGSWKNLIVDEHSKRLLLANLTENDILSERVTTIDLITSYRAPEPNMEAMYIIMPTSQNIDRVIRDFTDRQTYASAWLFLIDRIPEKLLMRLGQSPADPYLKTIMDLYINFWAVEAQMFSLWSPSSFFAMYSPPKTPSMQRAARDRLEEELRFAARAIGNLCVQLNENPTIRYYLPSNHPAVGPLSVPQRPAAQTNDSASSWRDALGVGQRVDTSNEDHLCKVLAFMVQEELNMYQKANPKWPEPTVPPRPQSVLIITDRTMDMAAPFIHEFTYQAMANDLLPIRHGQKFRYEFQSAGGGTEEKDAILSDSDALWVETRHRHIKETIDKVMGDFNRFVEQSGAFSSSGGAASLNDIKDMLADLPQYQQQREMFSLHLNMAQQCMDLFEKRKLTLVANVEQNSATGLTAESKTPKTLVEDMVPLLADSAITSMDKVRVIILYILYRDGVPEEDRRRLYEHAKLSRQERAAIDNLVSMCVRVTRVQGDKDTKKLLKNRPAQDDYDLSRFKPLLKTIIEDCVAGKLDNFVFPYVKEPARPAQSPTTPAASSQQPVSLRKQPVWAKQSTRGGAAGGGGASGRKGADNSQRVIVFVAGGMTYSELRTAYELSDSLGKNVYIGSTHSITPEDFILDLQVLDIGGQASVASNNSSSNAQRRPFQAYYDQKYTTKDEPPPPPAPKPVPAGLGPPGGKGRMGLSPSPSPAAGMTRSPSPGPRSQQSPALSPGPGSGAISESENKEKKKKRFLGF